MPSIFWRQEFPPWFIVSCGLSQLLFMQFRTHFPVNSYELRNQTVGPPKSGSPYIQKKNWKSIYSINVIYTRCNWCFMAESTSYNNIIKLLSQYCKLINSHQRAPMCKAYTMANRIHSKTSICPHPTFLCVNPHFT